jgi:hypothetical protein
LERTIQQIIPLDLMFDDPRLDIPSDATDSVEWLLKFDYSSVADPVLGSPAKKLPIPCKSVIKPTKTGLDQEIATMGQFIADETGTTNRSLARTLKEFR